MLNELKKYKDSYKVVPIYKELLADIKTPMQVLKNVKEISNKQFLFESASNGRFGRYSFIGFDPIMSVSCKDNKVYINDLLVNDEPINILRKILADYKSPGLKDVPFSGGLVGYFSYDFVKYSLKIEFTGYDEGFNDYELLLFDKLIAYDNFRQKIILIVNIKTDDLENNYQRGLEELDRLEKIVKNNSNYEIKPLEIIEELKSTVSKEEFCNSVLKCKEYIKNGDIFQAVLSRRFKGKAKGSLLNTYRAMRTINPSPYMLYMNMGKIEISSSSPETLAKLTDGQLLTFPIAGSRPRGENEVIDSKNQEELLNDPKELAEHNMLVDLGRNDIGRVSKFNSVEVLEYMNIVKFSHIMHISSTVKGEIKDGLDAIDAIQSILPAGTLSGAPKKRACEIINELENRRRGIYGGAIGYIDFKGNMDFAIGIRTVVKKNDDIYVSSGAGIVYDSVPETEFIETQNKAAAMLKSIEMSKEVL